MKTVIFLAYCWLFFIVGLAAHHFYQIAFHVTEHPYNFPYNYFLASIVAFVGLSILSYLIVRYSPRR